MCARYSNRIVRREYPRAAFTLLEVVVALMIVGMTAIATLSAFATEMRTAEKSRAALEAASLAQGKIAMLELLPPEVLVALPDSSSSGYFEPPFESYDWTASVAEVANESHLFEASVTVGWPNGRYTISTRMYRPVPPVSSL